MMYDSEDSYFNMVTTCLEDMLKEILSNLSIYKVYNT